MILSNINPVLSPSCKKLKFEFGNVANLKMHLDLSWDHETDDHDADHETDHHDAGKWKWSPWYWGGFFQLWPATHPTPYLMFVIFCTPLPFLACILYARKVRTFKFFFFKLIIFWSSAGLLWPCLDWLLSCEVAAFVPLITNPNPNLSSAHRIIFRLIFFLSNY